MNNEKITLLMNELKSLTYTWWSSGNSYHSKVINKDGVNQVEQVIRQFLLDNRDSEFVEMKEKISTLEAKVFVYEQIISKSNFAPMLSEEKKEGRK